MRVISYKVGYRPETGNYGRIELKLENNTSFILSPLSASKFNALYNILQNEPVYWNGTWLHTDLELVTE